MEKKESAAIAGVLHYLACQKQQLEAAQAVEEIEMEAPQPAAAAPSVQHPWALSGRQAQMQMRNMMQMKAFH